MENKWANTIENWVNKSKSTKEYKKEFISFFEKVINECYYPERAFFGTNKDTISIVIGHLYLGVYVHSGIDKGIGMIVEKQFHNIEGVICKPVKSTLAKTSKYKLFWLWIPEIINLHKILDVEEIWESFKIASKQVIETPQGKTTREREKKGKIILTELRNPSEIISEEIYSQTLQTKIENAKKISKEKRKKKLKEVSEIPEKITITSVGFKRNPYIIIEVLERANGFCELCKMEAPFLRIKDDTPFLEVHHIQPLAEGGKDTVKNTVALCPNCHREAHFGINKEKLKEKLSTAHNNA